MIRKERLDKLLLEKGLVQSREKARAFIMEGKVLVDGAMIDKPGVKVDLEANIRLQEEDPLYVSRGGRKLKGAIEAFGIDPTGMVVMDVGASTGGFTDCILQEGARKVYAVDVGCGQLDYRLRQDPRVVVMEEVNARYPIPLPEKVDLATIDLSFISVEKVIPPVANLLKDGGYLLVLIKPQFEAKRREVGKGGVIKDPLLHATVLGRFITWVVAHDFRLKGLVASPILGSSGNKEFFALLTQNSQ